MRRRNFVALGISFAAAPLVGTATGTASAPAQTQTQTQTPDFPSKPITILVGYAAGGNIDVTARTVAQAMSKVLGRRSSSTTGRAPRA